MSSAAEAENRVLTIERNDRIVLDDQHVIRQRGEAVGSGGFHEFEVSTDPNTDEDCSRDRGLTQGSRNETHHIDFPLSVH